MYRIFDDSGFHSDETFESIKEATGFIDDVLTPDQITYFVTDTSTGITAVIVHDSKVWKPVDAAAPDLLAALTEILARLDRVLPPPNGKDTDLRAYARRAIAAAKGENDEAMLTL